jgi:hypothetical protein
MIINGATEVELFIDGELLARYERGDDGITIHDGKSRAWVDGDEIPHLIEFLSGLMPPQDSATPPPSGVADSRSAKPSPGGAPAPDYCPVTDLVDAGGLSPDAAAALVRALEAMVAEAVGRAAVPLAASLPKPAPTPSVWLPNCKPGDVCVRRDGEREIYACKWSDARFGHVMQSGRHYSDLGHADVTYPHPLDIVAVIPSDHSGPSGTACDTLAKECAR